MPASHRCQAPTPPEGKSTRLFALPRVPLRRVTAGPRIRAALPAHGAEAAAAARQDEFPAPPLGRGGVTSSPRFPTSRGTPSRSPPAPLGCRGRGSCAAARLPGGHARGGGGAAGRAGGGAAGGAAQRGAAGEWGPRSTLHTGCGWSCEWAGRLSAWGGGRVTSRAGGGAARGAAKLVENTCMEWAAPDGNQRHTLLLYTLSSSVPRCRWRWTT